MDLLHTHVTGVLSHGHGSFHAYVDIGEYPHDPNLTINIILKELLRQAKASESVSKLSNYQNKNEKAFVQYL